MTETGKEYSQALFSLAREGDAEAEILQGLKLVQKVFASTPDFALFLKAPSIAKDIRLSTIEKVFEGSLHKDLISVLSLLTKNGEIGLLDDLADHYERLYNNSQRLVHTVIKSAVELTSEQKNNLENQLKKSFSENLETEYIIDSSLLGGVRVEADGMVLDKSLKHRLKIIKEEVMGK